MIVYITIYYVTLQYAVLLCLPKPNACAHLRTPKASPSAPLQPPPPPRPPADGSK